MIGRERGEREHVGLGAVHELGDLGELASEHVRGAIPRRGDLVRVRVHEHRPQRGRDDVLVAFGDAGQDVAGEVHSAALPRRALHGLADRGFQAFVGVGDHEAHPGEPATAQRAEELGPERLFLRIANREPEDFAVAVGSDPGRDHDGA